MAGRILLLLALLLPVGTCWGEELQVGGFWKNSLFFFRPSPGLNESSGVIVSDRLRIELPYRVGEDLVELALDNLLLFADPPTYASLPDADRNRLLDLQWDREICERWIDLVQVDRLNWQGGMGDIDWGIGRQAIGFGRIAIVSPLDVIAPFPPDALDTDVRPGVDAVRIARHFDLGGHLGATAVFGRQRDRHSYLLTGSNHLAGLDLLGLAGWLRGRPMAGCGIAGDLGGLGLKGEIAAYRGKDHGEPGGDLHERFAVAALEGWFRFDNGLITLLEYFYNGPGADDPDGYRAAAVSAPLQEGLTYLLGRHYLFGSVSYLAHPLVNLQGLVIWNLKDGSTLLRPLVDLSLGDNLALQLFWNLTTGASPDEPPLPGLPPVWRSEFGSAGDSGGALLKYYF